MNCQPNDLAVSIGTELAVNNGIIVRVVRPHVNSDEWNFGELPTWWCESDQPLTWRFNVSGRIVKAYEGPIPDQLLRPIRPPKPPAPEKKVSSPTPAQRRAIPTQE